MSHVSVRISRKISRVNFERASNGAKQNAGIFNTCLSAFGRVIRRNPMITIDIKVKADVMTLAKAIALIVLLILN